MAAHSAVFETIRAASLMVAVLEERALRPRGLSHAGYRVLCELWIKGPLEPRELAAFMMVSRPAIVGSVDTLEAAGYVRRAPSTRDRRRVTIVLARAGLRAVEEADAAWHEGQCNLMAALKPAEQRLLADLSRRSARSALALRNASLPRRPAEATTGSQ